MDGKRHWSHNQDDYPALCTLGAEVRDAQGVCGELQVDWCCWKVKCEVDCCGNQGLCVARKT